MKFKSQKITAILSALCLLLTGCQGSGETGTSGAKVPSVTTPLEEFDQSGTISETELYNKNNIIIKATKITYGSSSAEIELTIENKTSKELNITSGTIGYSCNSVNGLMMPYGYINTNVPAGGKTTESISLSYDELQIYGIDELADIELGFSIKAQDFSDDTFEDIYTEPCSIKTTLASSHDYSEPIFLNSMKNTNIREKYGIIVNYIGESTLFDSSNVKVISQVLATNKDGEQVLFLEVENSGTQQLAFKTSDIFVNGLKIENGGFSYDLINSGKRSITALQLKNMLDTSFWESLGINTIGSIDITGIVAEPDSYDSLADSPFKIDINSDKANYDGTGKEVYSSDSIKIVSKGVFGGTYDRDDDKYLLFTVENKSDNVLKFTGDSDSLKINGTSTNCVFDSFTLNFGETTVLLLALKDYNLQPNGITSVEDIKNAEMKLLIKDDKSNEDETAEIKIEF